MRLELGFIPLVPAPVVAQVSRSSRQVQLRRFLKGCIVVPFSEADAHRVGRLLGASQTVDVVDAAVVTIAAERDAIILTGDPDDIGRLARATGSNLCVIPA
jgi:predicted nucleic acid-binding protein